MLFAFALLVTDLVVVLCSTDEMDETGFSDLHTVVQIK